MRGYEQPPQDPPPEVEDVEPLDSANGYMMFLYPAKFLSRRSCAYLDRSIGCTGQAEAAQIDNRLCWRHLGAAVKDADCEQARQKQGSYPL